MCVTSRLLLILYWCLSQTIMTSTKPLSPPCTDGSPINLLAMSLAESSLSAASVEVVDEASLRGYRFFPEAKLLSVLASEVMVNCDLFPQEFSVVLTFLREIPRNEKEFLLTLIGPDRRSVLFAISIQRNAIHVDYERPDSTTRHASSFRDSKLTNGAWHTLAIVVARGKVKFNLDCRYEVEKNLSHPFPSNLNTRGSRFHIASRRRVKNRFTIVECRVPGSDFKQEDEMSVQIQDDQDVAMTCTSDNKGQLLYRKESGNLEMCDDFKWTRLATTNERLDYVADFGKLMTKSKTHDIELFRIPGEGLFLASANQGRGRNMDSTIYQWDEKREEFVIFQNISTDTARDWEYFSIENEHFLAVANHGTTENMIEAQSAIYRWHRRRRKFVLLQYIRTFDARNWESFTIDDKHFLAVSNHASRNGHRQKSWIYVWDPDHRGFVKYQPIDTTGCYDMEHFQIDDHHYLAVANSYDGVTSRMHSVVYRWFLSSFVPFQYFETIGATDWEYFSISGKHFLAVANFYDNSPNRNTYAVDSYVYQYHPDLNKFIKLQDLKTIGALDIEHFTIGKEDFLIASSTGDDRMEPLTSVIYRWQGMEHFVPVHNFSTNPCSDWESFRSESGKYFLVSANVMTKTSKILQLVTY